jgi:hypothetical protein
VGRAEEETEAPKGETLLSPDLLRALKMARLANSLALVGLLLQLTTTSVCSEKASQAPLTSQRAGSGLDFAHRSGLHNGAQSRASGGFKGLVTYAGAQPLRCWSEDEDTSYDVAVIGTFFWHNSSLMLLTKPVSFCAAAPQARPLTPPPPLDLGASSLRHCSPH